MDFYNTGKKKLLDGDIDLLTDTIKVCLLDNTHSADIDNDEYYDDISGDEVSASGDYSAGGSALASKTTTVDTGDDVCTFDAQDVGWNGASFTARYAVIYKDTGTASTSPSGRVSPASASQSAHSPVRFARNALRAASVRTVKKPVSMPLKHPHCTVPLSRTKDAATSAHLCPER